MHFALGPPLGSQFLTRSRCALVSAQLWATGTGAVASLDQVQEARPRTCDVVVLSCADPFW